MIDWTQKHATVTLLLGGLLVALVALAGYASGQAFSYAVVYLLPVVLITWILGQASGLCMALACAIASAGVDFLAGRSAAHTLWELTSNGSIFSILSVVLAELRKALEQAQHNAEHDSLTGLANRRAFYQQAAGELARCWPVTFSIGVATFICPLASVDALVQTADQQMYAAKQSGKNTTRQAVIEGEALAAGAVRLLISAPANPLARAGRICGQGGCTITPKMRPTQARGKGRSMVDTAQARLHWPETRDRRLPC